jgi:hypothetical protein
MRRIIIAVTIAAALAAVSGCGGSEGAADAGGATTAATTTAATTTAATTTKPAHDLRITTELEQYVINEWNKIFADPAEANYAEGVTVKRVKCVPVPNTAKSDCTITPSKGQAKLFGYLVAEDGSSAERVDYAG